MNILRRVGIVLLSVLGVGAFYFYVSDIRYGVTGRGEVSVILAGAFRMLSFWTATICLGLLPLLFLRWRDPLITILAVVACLALTPLAGMFAKQARAAQNDATYQTRTIRLNEHVRAHHALLQASDPDPARLEEIFLSYIALDLTDDGIRTANAPIDFTFRATFSLYLTVFTDMDRTQYFGFDSHKDFSRSDCARFLRDYAHLYDPDTHAPAFKTLCPDT